MPDVCLHESESALKTPSNEAEPREIEHRRGSVDPHELDSGAREGKRDPAGAAAQFQHGGWTLIRHQPKVNSSDPIRCCSFVSQCDERVGTGSAPGRSVTRDQSYR